MNTSCLRYILFLVDRERVRDISVQRQEETLPTKSAVVVRVRVTVSECVCGGGGEKERVCVVGRPLLS